MELPLQEGRAQGDGQPQKNFELIACLVLGCQTFFMNTILPAFPQVPQIKGRILIGGEIRDKGFETTTVFSTCHKGGDHVLLGTTPHVNIATLNEAVEAGLLPAPLRGECLCN